MFRQSLLPLLVALVSGGVGVLACAAPSAPDDPLAAMEGRQDIPVEQMVRVAEAPVIDGVLDEPAWETALIIDDFRQVEPVEGGVPSEKTEMRLLYDADSLYVAFRCFDREPEKIIATQMKRDAMMMADDRIAFIVDPFFDRRNGFFFEMNPAGARTDALIEDNKNFRVDWDGIWYGRASIDEQGWAVEIAIPFQTLSFNPDSTRWSFNASRFIRRRNESLRWASPSQNINFSSIADAGVIEGIHDLRQGKGIDVKPWGLARAKRDHDGDRNGFDIDGGLDVFYKPTPTLTLALTINTDFAETEVDERRINLTRFPLFFPEKRDFFLQDAGIFNFGGIRRNPLPFHSRRIGLGPDGEPRGILAGAKLTGRVGGLNLGLLDVQMEHDSELGNKNLFVGRTSINVLEQSTIGGIFTYGDPQTDAENYVAGLDFNFRTTQLDGQRTLEAHAWALTSDSTGVDSGQSAWGIKADYPNDRVRWGVGMGQIDENFNAALGFVPRRGIREYFGDWRYRWRPDSDLIRTIDSGVRGTVITDLDDNVETERLGWEVVEIETESGDHINFSLNHQREVLDDDFEIADGVVLAPDDYRWDRYSARFRSSSGRPVSVGLEYGGGDFYTGTRDDYEIELEWRVSRYLFLGGEFEMNDVDLDEGDFITRIMRGRVNVYFTPDLSWLSYFQYDSLSESVGVNSRVRWIIEPGNEMFFVLNQAIDRDDSSYRVTQTEMTTKVGWTFRF